jgi:tRNA nucleotidyltransferase/poly(A) polymerase
MEQTPSRMFDVLRDCGALARILPELDALWGVPQPAKYHPEIDTGVHVMMVLEPSTGSSLSTSRKRSWRRVRRRWRNMPPMPPTPLNSARPCHPSLRNFVPGWTA